MWQILHSFLMPSKLIEKLSWKEKLLISCQFQKMACSSFGTPDLLKKTTFGPIQNTSGSHTSLLPFSARMGQGSLDFPRFCLKKDNLLPLFGLLVMKVICSTLIGVLNLLEEGVKKELTKWLRMSVLPTHLKETTDLLWLLSVPPSMKTS